VSRRAVRLSASTVSEPDDLAADTIADLEAWWRDEFPAVHGDAWTPVADVVAATPDLDEIPACGAPITYPDVVEFGAFYCPDTDTIVYDGGGTGFLAELAETVGPATIPVVLAHEYGHAVQSRAGDLDRGLAIVYGEQQADCYAGAWIQRVTSGGSELVVLSDADVRAALVAMIAVRDPIGSDPLSGNGHGSAFDRIGAFQEGFREGAARCAELLDDPLPLVPNEFLSATDAINEGDLPFGFDEGSIGPLIVDTLNGYWSFELGDEFTPITLVPTDDVAAACSAEPVTAITGVAWCPADGTVIVDTAVAQQVYEDPIEGRADFAVGYLLAVGWAEAIQSIVGSEATGEARALANDCLAGAYALDMLPRAPRPDEGDGGPGAASPGDLDEAALAAIQLGDATSADDVVGSPIEKTTRFRTGVLGGFDACRPLFDD
jgi:predicted metalloprotease